MTALFAIVRAVEPVTSPVWVALLTLALFAVMSLACHAVIPTFAVLVTISLA